MSASILALIGFVVWTIVLVLTAVTYRVVRIAMGAPAESWARGKSPIVPDAIRRIEHAHLNCIENLPLFGGVVLAAVASDQLAVVDPMAGLFLATRVIQSVVHAIQVSHWMVLLRGTFWSVQIVLLIYWCLALAHWV